MRTKATKLVDPVEYFKAEYPEAFEFLPDGAASLNPEVSLMVQLAVDNGEPTARDTETGNILVPLSICEFVFDAPLTSAQITDYLNAHVNSGHAHSRREAA